MSRDTNIVVLVGRLTRDIELPQGQGPARFSLAVNRPKKQGDTYIDEASFFDVDYWHKTGRDYLVKGKQVCVTGELQQQRWEKDGQQRSKVVIVADDVQLLGGMAGQGEARTGTDERKDGNEPPRKAAPRPAPAGAITDDFSDDIPF